MATPLTSLNFQGVGADGLALPGGLLYSYAAGTLTPQATYTDATGSVAHANPVVLDAAGQRPIWLGNDAYRFILKTALGVTVRDVDNVTAAGGLDATLRADLANVALTAKGAGQIGFAHALNYPVGTVGWALRKARGANVFNYMTQAQIDSVLAGLFSLDVTAPVQAALDAEGALWFPPGGYAVTNLTFPNKTANYDMLGAVFRGIGTTARDSILRIETIHGMFRGLAVNGNFNDNYTCAVQWLCTTSASQYNHIDGLFIYHARRGLVYGALPGAPASSGHAQSENSISGFRTRGVQNPYWGNHAQGVLTFNGPVFVSLNNEWPASPAFDFVNATAITNANGIVVVNGGQVQQAANDLGVAAVVPGVHFHGTVFETSPPVQIGDKSTFDDCEFYDTKDAVSQFVVGSGITGIAEINNCRLRRGGGVGAYSSTPLVNMAPGASSFFVKIAGGLTQEWAWPLISKGPTGVYQGRVGTVSYRRTAADPRYFVDDNKSNLYTAKNIDTLGYTTSGWYLTNDFGGGTTFGVAVDGPPVGNLASSLELNATGQAVANNVDTTSAATIKATGFRVKPGSTFVFIGWAKKVSGTTPGISVRWYDMAGVFISETVFIQTASFSGTDWTHLTGMITAPANAAYAGVGAFGATCVIRFANFVLHPADDAAL